MLSPMADLAERSRGGVTRLAVDRRRPQPDLLRRPARGPDRPARAGPRPAPGLPGRRGRGAGPPVRVGPPAAPVAGRGPDPGRHRRRARPALRAQGRGRHRHRHVRAQRPRALGQGRPGVRSPSAVCEPRLRATVMSFGYKYGMPVDADIVDRHAASCPTRTGCRSCAPLTGLDDEVRDYVLSRPGAAEFLDRLGPDCSSRSSRGTQREGKTLRDNRGRLHRRQAPQRRGRPRSWPPGCATTGRRGRAWCTATWGGSERRAAAVTRPKVVALGGGHGLSASPVGAAAADRPGSPPW